MCIYSLAEELKLMRCDCEIKASLVILQEETYIESQKQFLQEEKNKLHFEKEKIKQELYQIERERNSLQREKQQLSNEKETLHELEMNLKRKSSEIEEIAAVSIQALHNTFQHKIDILDDFIILYVYICFVNYDC